MGASLSFIARKVFGSKNDRELKRLRPSVEAINRLEASIAQQSDDQLRARIAEWKAKLSAIEDREEREEAMEEETFAGRLAKRQPKFDSRYGAYQRFFSSIVYGACLRC